MTNSTGVQRRHETTPGRQRGQPPSDGVHHADLLKSELHRIENQLRQMGARKIILFGSYARGRADVLTDLDLVVVMDSELPFVQRTAEVYRRIVPRVAADILVYTPDEWQRMQDRPFGQQVLREGKVLYEKSGRRGRPPVARSGQRRPEVGPEAGR